MNYNPKLSYSVGPSFPIAYNPHLDLRSNSGRVNLNIPAKGNYISPSELGYYRRPNLPNKVSFLGTAALPRSDLAPKIINQQAPFTQGNKLSLPVTYTSPYVYSGYKQYSLRPSINVKLERKDQVTKQQPITKPFNMGHNNTFGFNPNLNKSKKKINKLGVFLGHPISYQAKFYGNPTSTTDNPMRGNVYNYTNQDEIYDVVDKIYKEAIRDWLNDDYKKLFKYFKVDKSKNVKKLKKKIKDRLPKENVKHIISYIKNVYLTRSFVKRTISNFIKVAGIDWNQVYQNRKNIKKILFKKLKEKILD